MRLVNVQSGLKLADYQKQVELASHVAELRAEGHRVAKVLRGKRVWMINSVAQGGGVAEMLPRLVATLREVGIDVEWAVLEVNDSDFFPLTKRLHNMLHGVNGTHLGDGARALIDRVSEENFHSPGCTVRGGDIVVVHDPQPLALGARIKERLGTATVWRCHIGLDRSNEVTEEVWSFLRPWAETYDRTVFSLPSYAPRFLRHRARVISPSVDPFSHKNRDLSTAKLSGILENAGLVTSRQPPVTEPFAEPVERLRSDGTFGPAVEPEEIGLLARPTILQVSRWDKLKGFDTLLDAFAQLKKDCVSAPPSRRCQRKVELCRLILAGPDPGSVGDDPQAQSVLKNLTEQYRALPEDLKRDVAILRLPMRSRKENALIVNALQRCATIVVQNSRQEGFGLTVTEAMWKGCAIIGTHAAGIRAQIRDGIDGRIVGEGTDPKLLARALLEALAANGDRAAWGANARERAGREFLLFAQARRWLSVLEEVAAVG